MIKSIFHTLPFTVCLFWSVIFLIEYRRADPAKKLLTFFMIVCSFLYFSHAVYFNKNIPLFSVIESLYAFCTLAVYPLYYLYICKLTDPKPFQIKSYWILIPSIVISLWAALFYVLLDDNRISFVENNLFNSLQNVNNLSFAAKGQSYRLVIMKIVFIFQLILICIFSFKKLIRFDKQIKNYYANTEEKELTPIKRLLIVFIIYAFLSVIANHVGRVFFLQEPWLVIIPSLIFSSMIFAIGYVGYKHILITDELYKETNYDIADKSIVMETTQTPYMSSQLGEAINQLMEEKEVFRQKGLLITDVAREIGSNRTYVSNYINKELNISFSEFINIYRIKFAQSLLTDTNQSYSMLEIIELSGFSHEGSFYRTFKKQTGLTPAQWREQQCSHIESL